MLILSRKRQMTERMELTNQEKNQIIQRKGKSKILKILKVDTIKQAEMKEKKKKEYLRRTRKLLETKLYSRNLIKEIDTWAASLPCKILGTILKVDIGRTLTNGLENKWRCIRPYIPEMTWTDCIWQKRWENRIRQHFK